MLYPFELRALNDSDVKPPLVAVLVAVVGSVSTVDP
jgi:hypothetical protein